MVREMTMRNIKDYGAVGDGATLETAAIQRAVDDGGMVYIPEGTYRTGTIYLRSNGGLHLAPGATLIASHNREDYNTDNFCAQNRVFTSEFVTGAHLITAVEQKNIIIEGHGTIDGEGNLFVGTYEDVLTITATAGEATDSVEIEIVGPALEADGLGIANGFRLVNTDLFTDASGAHVAVNLDITPTGIYSGLYDAGYVGAGDATYLFSNDGKGGYYYNTTEDLLADTTIGQLWADMDLTAALDGYIYSYYEPEDLDAGVIANNVYLKMYDEDSDDPELFIYYTLGLSDVIGADLVATQLHVEAASGAALSIDFLYSYEESLYYIDFDIYEKTELDQKPYAVAIEDGGSTEEGVTEPWGE